MRSNFLTLGTNSFSTENFNYFSATVALSYETDLEPKRGLRELELELSLTVL